LGLLRTRAALILDGFEHIPPQHYLRASSVWEKDNWHRRRPKGTATGRAQVGVANTDPELGATLGATPRKTFPNDDADYRA
jgi:hypothetical protein